MAAYRRQVFVKNCLVLNLGEFDEANEKANLSIINIHRHLIYKVFTQAAIVCLGFSL